MKQCLLFIVLGICGMHNNSVHAQVVDSTATHMLRFFEDNDFLDIRGNGTDNSYTNGTRLDYFYSKNKRSRFFIDRLAPKAGDSSVNVFGWSLTQLMVTPNDITVSAYQPNDYPYAGALFTTHSIHSMNPVKKYSFQTDIIAGIRGPASVAREFQSFIHSLIGYDKPMGWDNQLRTYILVNINFTAEKELFAFKNFFDVIGGARIEAGTYVDAITLYPLIRIGKMAPWFNGFFSRYGSFYRNGRKKKTQFYFVVKPESSLVAHNALLHGHRMNADKDVIDEDSETRTIRHRLANIQLGGILSHGNFSFSYTQTHSTEYNQGLYRHNWGNVTVSFKW